MFFFVSFYFNLDPSLSVLISVQLLPLYVMDQMHWPGLPGLFTACIFSGALR